MSTKRNVLVQVLENCDVVDDSGNPVHMEAMQVYKFSLFDEHERHANGIIENFGWIFRLMPKTYRIINEESE